MVLGDRGANAVSAGMTLGNHAVVKKGDVKGAARRGGCADFGCGNTNDNEALLRD